ncbi:MAG TPA: ROK family protein [Ktedonobacteraceae bacterium]|jgi:glucokinase
MAQILAVEIGGSQVRAAIVEDTEGPPDDGHIGGVGPQDTPIQHEVGIQRDILELTPESLIEEVMQIADMVVRKAEGPQAGRVKVNIVGIGVAIAAEVDMSSRAIIPTYTKTWSRDEFYDPLLERLRQVYSTVTPNNVVIGNLSNMAAVGELYHLMRDRQRSSRQIVYLLIGGGIGTGIIINGQPYIGAHGLAGEFGHNVVVPNGPECQDCGLKGCVAAMASGDAILRKVIPAIEQGEGYRILEDMQRRRDKPHTYDALGTRPFSHPGYRDIKRIDGRAVCAAAERGDPLAEDALKEAAYYVGQCMAQIIHALNPDMLVLGGLAMRSNIMFQKAFLVSQQFTLPTAWQGLRIIQSQLGDHAAMIGVARRVSPGTP